MSASRFTAKKKTTKNIGEEKSTNTENQKHPAVLQLHLSLIYLHCATN
jgi:hypothetical protein